MEWNAENLLSNLQLKDGLPESLKNDFSEILSGNKSNEEKSSKLYENFLELVGCFIQGNILLTHVLSLLESCSIASHDEGSSALSDALWFWGTQIQSSSENGDSWKKSERWIKLCSLVREVNSAGYVDSDLLKTSLEFNLLCGAGICKDEVGTQKKLIKINTSLVYRQQKYNLLREETEGYSKIVTILSTLPAPPEDPASHIKNIFSVIGYFDLDPNRVIDVVLDVFEQQAWNLSFLKVLRLFKRANIVHLIGFKFTSYDSSASEASIPKAINAKNDNANASTTSAVTSNEKPVSASSKISGVQPPPPPPPPPLPSAATSTAATSSTLTDVAATPLVTLQYAPQSLYILAALLLSEKLITLKELAAYLSPAPADTLLTKRQAEEVKNKVIKSFGVVSLGRITVESKDDKKREKEKDSKMVESKSQSTAKDLTDPNSSVSTAASAPSPYSLWSDGECYANGDQYAGLLAAALTLRCWTVAEDIMTLTASLAKTTEFDFLSNDAPKDALIGLLLWVIEPLYSPFSAHRLGLASRPSMLLPTQLLIPPLTGQYPQLTQLSDLPVAIEPMLMLLSHRLHSSPMLLTQISRLLKEYIQSTLTTFDYTSTENLACSKPLVNVFNILSNSILPALSCSDDNPALSACVWKTISILPFQFRFAIYSKWKGNAQGKDAIGLKHSDLVHAEVQALFASRGHLKRLSKENTKQIGRQVSKCTHSNPMVVYNYILSQIESFDNLIPLVVEALKYTTEIAKDTMAFCLLQQLLKDSEKLKAGDTHYSMWFAALSKFIAVFYRRYPTTEIKGLLHFLLKKLAAGESLDLLVLKDLLSRMGGCETFLEVSTKQLEGFAGGRTLRAEVMGAQVKEVANKKAVRALRDELMSSNTALPLLLLIAQIRTRLLYEFETPHLKLISHLYDTSQDVLMQFTDFLVSGGGAKGLEGVIAVMPSLSSLLKEVELAIPVALQLVRPIMRAALQCGDDPSCCPPHLQPWHPFAPEMIELIRSSLPNEVWDAFSPTLYVTFWSLSLYDLAVPKLRYDLEVRRLKDRYTELDQKPKDRGIGGAGGMTAADEEKANKVRRQEMTRLLNAIKALHDEVELQTKHCQQIKRLMTSQKASYFSAENKVDGFSKTTEAILQYCVFPRMLMSPADAVYCSHFFLSLHEMDTPGFNTVHFLDKMIKTISPLIFCSTESEAAFIGYGLNDLLKTVNKWQLSKKIFEAEAFNKIGFLSSSNADKKINFTQFCEVGKVWHQKLRLCVSAALRSQEYMHLRSALVLLSKIAEQFPTRMTGGKVVLGRVELLEKGEAEGGGVGREDLRIMARSLGAILKRRMSSWLDDEVKDRKVIAPAPLPPTPAGGLPPSSSSNSSIASTAPPLPPSKTEKSVTDGSTRKSSSEQRGREDNSDGRSAKPPPPPPPPPINAGARQPPGAPKLGTTGVRPPPPPPPLPQPSASSGKRRNPDPSTVPPASGAESKDSGEKERPPISKAPLLPEDKYEKSKGGTAGDARGGESKAKRAKLDDDHKDIEKGEVVGSFSSSSSSSSKSVTDLSGRSRSGGTTLEKDGSTVSSSGGVGGGVSTRNTSSSSGQQGGHAADSGRRNSSTSVRDIGKEKEKETTEDSSRSNAPPAPAPAPPTMTGSNSRSGSAGSGAGKRDKEILPGPTPVIAPNTAGAIRTTRSGTIRGTTAEVSPNPPPPPDKTYSGSNNNNSNSNRPPPPARLPPPPQSVTRGGGSGATGNITSDSARDLIPTSSQSKAADFRGRFPYKDQQDTFHPDSTGALSPGQIQTPVTARFQPVAQTGGGPRQQRYPPPSRLNLGGQSTQTGRNSIPPSSSNYPPPGMNMGGNSDDHFMQQQQQQSRQGVAAPPARRDMIQRLGPAPPDQHRLSVSGDDGPHVRVNSGPGGGDQAGRGGERERTSREKAREQRFSAPPVADNSTMRKRLRRE